MLTYWVLEAEKKKDFRTLPHSFLLYLVVVFGVVGEIKDKHLLDLDCLSAVVVGVEAKVGVDDTVKKFFIIKTRLQGLEIDMT